MRDKRTPKDVCGEASPTVGSRESLKSLLKEKVGAESPHRRLAALPIVQYE